MPSTEMLEIPSIDTSYILIEISDNGEAKRVDRYEIEKLIREYVHKIVLPSLRDNHIEVKDSDFELYYDYRMTVDYRFTSGAPCRILWRIHPLEPGFKDSIRRAIKTVADMRNFTGFNTKAYEVANGKRVTVDTDIHSQPGMLGREDVEVEWIHTVVVRRRGGKENVSLSSGNEGLTNLYAKAIIELSRKGE